MEKVVEPVKLAPAENKMKVPEAFNKPKPNVSPR